MKFSVFSASWLIATAASTLPATCICAADVPTPESLNTLIAASKGTPVQNLYLGRQAFLNYDFPKAESLFEAFAASRKKSADSEYLLNVFTSQLEVASESLGNVQRLKLLTRSEVPESDFLSAIRLPSSAGVILPPDSIPFEQGRNEATMAFANEARNYMLWSQAVSADKVKEILSESEDSDFAVPSHQNIYMIVESELLTDGSWTAPRPLRGLGPTGIDADFPFMRADGATLYFSSPSGGAMGGYDLFVAMRDPQTGRYLAPRNLGMPFNSPFDDLMVAVDEENGLAWLVTDRTQKEGKIDVFLYVFEESRTNYDSESADLLTHARLENADDYLPQDDELRIAKLRLLDNISNTVRKKRRDFSIAVPGCRTYTMVENFTSPKARLAAGKYLSELQADERDRITLSRLRSEYHEAHKKKNSSQQQFLASRILQLEEALEARATELKALRNEAIMAETER